MQRLSENGARPVIKLGGLQAPPLFRWGALVFQPNNSEPLYWASRSAPTRIAGCALGHRPTDTRWENVSPERRSASGFAPPGPWAPTAPPWPRANQGGDAARGTISFSLWTVVAKHAQKTPGSSSGSCRERMHPQSTDELSAQGALLQSPILSAAGTRYHFNNPIARPTKTMT
jgi:hypothetical protein